MNSYGICWLKNGLEKCQLKESATKKATNQQNNINEFSFINM
jgi:hypothetical protein